MLTVRSLNQFYAESHILRDVDLAVPRGSCVALMGRNGVGKTTLLNCVMGHLPVRSGTIHFGDTEITGFATEQRARLGIGYVPQGRMIFPLLTVEENLRIGLGAGRTRGSRIPDLVFELFPVLKTMLGRRGGDLSGGQQQQLAIARALIMRPKVLLLDEPTEGIQPSIIQQIGHVLEYLKAKGDMAIVLVEQYFEFAYGLADQVYVFRRGAVAASGRAGDFDKADLRAAVSV